MKALGSDRIVLVQNTFFGRPEALPFDLRPRRILSYSSDPNSIDRSETRRQLEITLEKAIRLILGAPVDLSGAWRTSWRSIRTNRLHEAILEIPPDEGRSRPVKMTVRYYRDEQQTIVRQQMILSRSERNKVELKGKDIEWVERGAASNYVCDIFHLTVTDDGEIMRGDVILTNGVSPVVFRRTSISKFDTSSSSHSR